VGVVVSDVLESQVPIRSRPFVLWPRLRQMGADASSVFQPSASMKLIPHFQRERAEVRGNMEAGAEPSDFPTLLPRSSTARRRARAADLPTANPAQSPVAFPPSSLLIINLNTATFTWPDVACDPARPPTK